MTRAPEPVYKEGERLAPVSSHRTVCAMPYHVIIQAFVLLHTTRVVFGGSVLPWSSSQTGDSFTCDFATSDGTSGSPFCYFPENPEPIMARSENLFLIRGGVVRGRQSAVWPNGTVIVSLNPLFAHRPCVVCQWYQKSSHSQTCLACRGMAVRRARHSDDLHLATLVDTGVDITATKQYFLCRFRVPRNATGGQTAWLSDRCLPPSRDQGPANPMDSCAVSPSYIPLRRSGTHVIMRARIKAEDTCRVCMIRVNGGLTIGRACLDARTTTLIRDVKIGRLLVLGIWTTSLIVAIVSIVRFLYNTKIIQGFFKKANMVRTCGPLMAVLPFLWLSATSGAITISVPDAKKPDIVRYEDVLEASVRLCLGPPISDKQETLKLLER